jgi:hypothetical protein
VPGVLVVLVGAVCVLNFWRCRQAHCVVNDVGWLGLALVAFVGAGLGHSVIGGYEQPVFLGVLVSLLEELPEDLLADFQGTVLAQDSACDLGVGACPGGSG